MSNKKYLDEFGKKIIENCCNIDNKILVKIFKLNSPNINHQKLIDILQKLSDDERGLLFESIGFFLQFD